MSEVHLWTRDIATAVVVTSGLVHGNLVPKIGAWRLQGMNNACTTDIEF